MLPLRVWLALSHLAVFCLPIVVLVASGALGQDLREQTREDLEHQAELLAMLLESEIALVRQGEPAATIADCEERLSERLRAAKDATWAGYELTDTAGRVAATSGFALGEDLSDRAEVQAALRGAMGRVVRPRPVARVPWPALSGPSRRASVRLFVAVPLRVDGEILGALVASRTPREELQALYGMAPRAFLALVAAVLATLGLAFGAGVLATRSLRTLDAGADRIARGDLEGVADLSRPELSRVAEVGRVARSVRRAAVRLRERLDYIGEFASNVSHEFKTPLATLRGTVELMLDEGADMPDEQRVRFLENASREIDRLERMVSGLLALARADQARSDERVDLDALLRRVAERHDVAVEGQARPVRGSAAQLEAVLENLLRNAREHGGSVVALHAVDEPDVTGFVVADDGPGIAEADLDHVFDRFFTTRRDQGGTGLGLALAKAVVVQHGGTIGVGSASGETRFTVRLPTT